MLFVFILKKKEKKKKEGKEGRWVINSSISIEKLGIWLRPLSFFFFLRSQSRTCLKFG